MGASYALSRTSAGLDLLDRILRPGTFLFFCFPFSKVVTFEGQTTWDVVWSDVSLLGRSLAVCGTVNRTWSGASASPLLVRILKRSIERLGPRTLSIPCVPCNDRMHERFSTAQWQHVYGPGYWRLLPVKLTLPQLWQTPCYIRALSLASRLLTANLAPWQSRKVNAAPSLVT